ncbi:MAG: 3-deoxy-manno-octulosonate cytidylyltransferase [Verrucomicrobiota bacterium]
MIPCALIIPARLSSQRFPRKLLHPINGKPLILWTADNLSKSDIGWPVFFAVEDEELKDVLEKAGHRAILTNIHPSGTDRIAEANLSVKAEIVINIQADEPLTGVEHVKHLYSLMANGADMGTLAHRFENQEDFKNPNRVKVVTGIEGQALYFSRAPIPHPRETDLPENSENTLLHLGMYAYTAKFLKAFTQLPQGTLEKIEKLEQLRALENGYHIQVGITRTPGFGVDTNEDAILLEQKLKQMTG